MNAKSIIAAIFTIGFSGNVSAATIGYIEGSDGDAAANVSQIAADLGLTDGGALALTGWNTMAGADLAAAFDVLVFGNFLSGALNADWTTRMLPYLNAGGSVIYEDSLNYTELAAGGLTFGGSTVGVPIFSQSIAGLTDSGTIFSGENFAMSAVSSAWNVIGTNTSASVTAFRTFASGGTFFINGSANFFQTTGSSNYIFARNMVDYAVNTPAPVPLPAAMPLMLAALGALGFMARRRKTTSPV